MTDSLIKTLEARLKGTTKSIIDTRVEAYVNATGGCEIEYRKKYGLPPKQPIFIPTLLDYWIVNMYVDLDSKTQRYCGMSGMKLPITMRDVLDWYDYHSIADRPRYFHDNVFTLNAHHCNFVNSKR